ncbi:sulfonate ABC transporter substrate-binding protein [Bacillus infantis]|uniref:sulfonate ABC transporter substrate-binding protein n=1 Tax=Bacillus infantis TaxID=324767 RepID=UPI0039826550
MKMKKSALFIFLALTLTLILAACGNKEEAGGEGTDTVKIGFQKGNTLNILKARGTLEERLKEENISVEWSEFPIGTALLEGLNTGRIDFGHASDANGVFSQASGKPSVYIASDTPYPEGVALVVKEDSPIESIEDLKGKKVAVTKGGNMHYLLDTALEANGLTIEDTEIVYYKDSAEGMTAFESGAVDVLGTWDPFLAVLESKTKTRTITNGENLTENRTFYFASQDYADNHADILKIILEELEKSDQWANENSKEVAEILSKELKIDSAPLKTAIERRTFGVLPIDEAAIKAQQDLADSFFKLGLFPEEIEIKDAVKESPDWYPEGI